MSLKITYEQVIASAKRILRLSQTTIHDDEIEKLVDWGCKQMAKINITTVLCADIPIDCYTAKLPDNCHKDEIICFSLDGGCACGGGCGCLNTTTTTILDPDGTEVSVTTQVASPFNGGCFGVYASPFALTDFCGSEASVGSWLNIFDITGGYIKFPSSTTATSVKVYFVGKYMDGAGLMVIDDDWEAGLAYCCAWQFALSYNELYTPLQTQQWMNMWVAQRDYLSASQQMVEFKKRKGFIRNLANSIMVDKNRVNAIF